VGDTVDTVGILAVIATIAGLLMAVSPTLQVRRMIRTRSSNDVSLLYLTMLCSGFVAWFAYGWALGNAAMIIANAASLVFMLFTIVVALRFRRVGAKRAAAGAAALAPVVQPQALAADAEPVEEG
jgi:MtN3 and saliva related transmembrane protein